MIELEMAPEGELSRVTLGVGEAELHRAVCEYRQRTPLGGGRERRVHAVEVSVGQACFLAICEWPIEGDPELVRVVSLELG
jgi:hypothetical protein